MRFRISAASGIGNEEVKEINTLEELLEYVRDDKWSYNGIIITERFEKDGEYEYFLMIYDDWEE